MFIVISRVNAANKFVTHYQVTDSKAKADAQRDKLRHTGYEAHTCKLEVQE